MNEYQKALTRIIELEDKLETADERIVELQESDIALVRLLNAEVAFTHGQNVDIGNQLRTTFALLKESRDMLNITALESPLCKDILELIERIDLFYPRI